MNCPVCDEKLREIEKYGVMVDICPSCKGVWLDRGELEKIAKLEERDDSERDDRDRHVDHRDRDDDRERSRDHGPHEGHVYVSFMFISFV
jgi:Zn-finger nucleic acid-binding protein